MDDQRLVRRLARDARAADRVAARVARGHRRALARAVRLRHRARRHLPAQLLVTVGSTAAVVGLGAGKDWLLLAAGSGLLTVRSAARLVRPVAIPTPPARAAAAAPPPPVGSAAFPAVRRLEVARQALTRLLPLVAPAGREAAEQAWRCAADNDHALRWQAARLAAVEPHRGAEPELLALLHAGVDAQERLVAGLADLVSASADPHAVLRLQDATDALHGLAAGLRELR
ncbi:MAG: hypothetical protein NVS3B26_00070 [Mycobacteriales bacterium]